MKKMLCLLMCVLVVIAGTTDSQAITMAGYKKALISDRYSARVMNTLTRDLVVDSCSNGSEKEAYAVVEEQLMFRLQAIRTGWENANEMEVISGLADAYLFLKLCIDNKVSLKGKAPFVKYLLANHERSMKVVEGISAQHDNVPNVFKLLEILYLEDSMIDRETYFDLILAIAIVWDQQRPNLHSQVSGAYLRYRFDPVKRYNYFKKLYAERKARMPYKYLDYSDLIYVVDTPVPISELEWAQKKIRSTLSRWGSLYKAVNYDDERLNRGEMTWYGNRLGPYSLANIYKKGGICVEQAYFCTITARALGIPSLFFTGSGRRGLHAWFSYMYKTNEWNHGIGRYEGDKYSVGQAINPQTNQQLSDHQVNMIYSRVFARKSYKKGHKYRLYADLLMDVKNYKQALAISKYATKLAPLDISGWEIRCLAAERAKDNFALLKALDARIAAFTKYPDLIVESQIYKASVLRRLGRDREAKAVLAKAKKGVDDERDDLEWKLAKRQVDDYLAEKKYKEARLFMEKSILDLKKEQAKLLGFVREYIMLTAMTQQTAEAVSFITKLFRSISKDLDDRNKDYARKLLAQAHINNGNKDGMKSAMRSIR